MFEAAPHPQTLKYILAGLALAAAASFLAIEYRARRIQRRALDWPLAPGIVTLSRTARRWGFGSGTWMAGLWYVPEVAYRYEVNGEKYTGRRVFLSDAGFAKLRKARDIVSRYPRAAEIAVHYDPANPRRACLEPAFREHRALGAALLLLAVAVAAVLA